MNDLSLSKNFKLSEFTKSDTAASNKIDNTPNAQSIVNMKLLCSKVLQPLRDSIGTSIEISSGYRCKALNSAIGGSKTSQHMKGQAADIKSLTMTPRELYDYILESDIVFDQMILEPTWVHISYRAKPRMQHWVL